MRENRRPQAESEEGRSLINENSHQSSTLSIQSEIRVSQGLARVRRAAKERKEMKFTALLHHLTVVLLRDSSYALRRKAAPGVDGVTWQKYETGREGSCAVKRKNDQQADGGPSCWKSSSSYAGACMNPVGHNGKWLRSIVQGYFNRHAVPGNIDSLSAFRYRVIRLWRTTLIHRSQKHHHTV